MQFHRSHAIPSCTRAAACCVCRQARKLFRRAIILGVHRAKVGVLAVPADELLLQAGDELFGLAYNGAEFKVTGANGAVRC